MFDYSSLMTNRFYAETHLRELLFSETNKKLDMKVLIILYNSLQKDGKKAFLTYLKLLKR
jgi:hypothetical protein